MGVELSLSNVLTPECTDGVTYDALYCDASLSEEDLPTFLSLLRPGGRMVVIIEEEALLVTRSGDPHDFEREVITHVSPLASQRAAGFLAVHPSPFRGLRASPRQPLRLVAGTYGSPP